MKTILSLFLAGALALTSCGKDDPIRVGSVQMNKTTLTLIIGEEQTLTATVAPDNAVDRSVVWQSSDPQVATVSDAGVVAALTPGTTTITATAGGKMASCLVTVDPIRVEGITLSKTELTFLRGGSETLEATVTPDDATYKSVTWESSNVKVATVSDAGVVEAVEPGLARITATADGMTATCDITVEPDVYVVGWNRGSNIFEQGALLWKNGEVRSLPFQLAESIFVYKGEVYVAGSYQVNLATETYCIVWKDNEEFDLLGRESYGTSVFVSDGNVYATGHRDNMFINYWENGISTDLPGAFDFSKGNCVYVSGKDVYVAGTKDGKRATYWKNKQVVDLTDGFEVAAIHSLVVAKGVVYSAGQEGNDAILWVNKERNVLPEGKIAYGVAVSEKGDVYVAGVTKNYSPALWVNGKLQLLEDYIQKAYSVFVYGDDVYVAGREALWKNGKKTALPEKWNARAVFVY